MTAHIIWEIQNIVLLCVGQDPSPHRLAYHFLLAWPPTAPAANTPRRQITTVRVRRSLARSLADRPSPPLFVYSLLALPPRKRNLAWIVDLFWT